MILWGNEKNLTVKLEPNIRSHIRPRHGKNPKTIKRAEKLSLKRCCKPLYHARPETEQLVDLVLEQLGTGGDRSVR